MSFNCYALSFVLLIDLHIPISFYFQDQFCEYMFQQAVKQDLKVLLENKSKFVQVHASSGHKHALKGNIFLEFTL